ncbi:uncharacterized protein F5147DRAFT_661645 [Suillus discolor]|uniref:DUF6532 domain-containing protein n=1 Tax=Suillus discolor TaxID=1912936 RepID=A0A9P7EPR7_9AGAM|nr:uncharacterized protein F5147DRAFT_661645 [Suillus discolor]KAG2079814.1 hypothetical protein F5147DRAFT_661645 [Suillus discolor]
MSRKLLSQLVQADLAHLTQPIVSPTFSNPPQSRKTSSTSAPPQPLATIVQNHSNDLESVLWIFLWVLLNYSGPLWMERNQAGLMMEGWNDPNTTLCVGSKYVLYHSGKAAFLRQIDPYFADLTQLADDWLELMRYNDEHPVAFDAVLELLDSFLSNYKTEEFSPERYFSSQELKIPLGENTYYELFYDSFSHLQVVPMFTLFFGKGRIYGEGDVGWDRMARLLLHVHLEGNRMVSDGSTCCDITLDTSKSAVESGHKDSNMTFVLFPATMPSPRKSKTSKRKAQDPDTGLPTGRSKKTPRGASDELGGTRHSEHSNAGTGGRNSQLEKLDAVLEQPSRKRSSKGSTTFGADVSKNPQAPDSRKGKGHKSRKVAAPPPYAPADVNLVDASQASNTQQDVPKMTIVPPGTEPNLQALNNPYVAAMIGTAAARPPTNSSVPSLIPHAPLEPNSQVLNNPYVAAMIGTAAARPPTNSSVPSLIPSAPLEPRFLDAIKYYYQPATSPQMPEHFIDPALRIQPSSLGVGGCLEPSVPNVTQYNIQPMFKGTALPRLPEGPTGPALQPQNRPPPISDRSDLDGSDENDESSMDKYNKEGVKDAGEDDIVGWGADFRRNNHLSHFKIHYSHNEDENGAAASLTSVQLQPHVQNSRKDDAAANLVLTQPKVDDVLKKHQKKNGQRRLPDPEALEVLRQQTETDVQQEAPTSRSEAKPTQLGWYGTGWKGFLEDAKAECRAVHALENPLPSLTHDLTRSIMEVLLSVKLAWEQAGKQVETGVWPAQKSNMARLLYDDLATWRSELKKVVISLAPSILGLVPPAEVPALERPAWVSHEASRQRKDSLFLRGGFDANYDCGLLGFKKNGTGKVFPKFTAKEYKTEYEEMLEMMGIVLDDAYHGPKLVKQLREWAAYGWLEGLKVDSRGSLEMKRTHLKVVLD